MSLATKVRMGLSLLRGRVTGRPVPVLVNWAVTGRCNLRCKHCYGAYGIDPWLDRVTGFPANSTAQWVWTDDTSGDDLAVFRLRFQVAQAPLAITTASLPGATVGEALSVTLAATGGNGGYTWSEGAQALPAFLSLSAGGVLSGTPDTAGSFAFDVQVSDAQSTVTRSLTASTRGSL